MTYSEGAWGSVLVILGRINFVLPRLSLFIFRFGLAFMAAWMIWLFSQWLPQAVGEKREWTTDEKRLRQEPGTGYLFRALLQRGLLRLDPVTLKISYPPADLPLQRRLTTPLILESDVWPITLDKRDEELIHILHGDSTIAKTIKDQVTAWNRRHELTAIRDDRDNRIYRSDYGSLVTQYEESNNRWDAEAIAKFQGFPIVESALLTQGLPEDLFGFFGWGEEAPAGDWLSAAGRQIETERIRFISRFGRVGNLVVVDLVGHDPRVEEGALEDKRLVFCPGRRLELAESKHQGKTTRAWEYTPTCEIEDSDDAVAYRLWIRPVSTDTPVKISVRPIRRIPDRLNNYTHARFNPGACIPEPGEIMDEACWNGWTAYEGGESIRVLCRDPGIDGPGPECALDWFNAMTREQTRPGKMRLYTADGRMLTDTGGNGLIADAALELGLAPLVGLGPGDRNGLSAVLLKTTPTDQDNSQYLTIDARLQEIASAALQTGLNHGEDLLPSVYNRLRRASLVLIDASGDRYDSGSNSSSTRGNVLAAVNLPRQTIANSQWNALAYENWDTMSSPLSPKSWARTNAYSAPGSTFKALTALALIHRAVESDDDLNNGPFVQAIKGSYDWQESPNLPLPDGVELKHNRVVVPTAKYLANAERPCDGKATGPIVEQETQRICNFQGKPHGKASEYPSISGCPTLEKSSSQKESKQYGLCEAMANSMNSWFVLAALALDGYKLPIVVNASQRSNPGYNIDDLELVKMTKRFLPPEERDLAQLDATSAPLGARFHADRILLGLEASPISPLLTLSQNSVGQDAQSSPLAVAGLFASIATGCRIRPVVTPGDGPLHKQIRTRECSPLFFGSTESDRNERALTLMRTYLVKGLSSVVNSPKGTAHGKFDPEFTQFVYGKTGTAELPFTENTILHSAWFAGWLEPEASGVLHQRIAFACNITHTKATGGQICAPVINELIRRLRAVQPKERGSDI